MRHTEFLIVGQGVSGTFLSRQLRKLGKKVLVIDDAFPSSSSRIAAGVINPVTGRRIVRTWMIETLLRFAVDAYTEFGNELGRPLILEKKIIDFFPSPQMLNAFTERLTEESLYLTMPVDRSNFREYFHYEFGFGQIEPGYVVQLQALLPAWREVLLKDDVLISDRFEYERLVVEHDHVTYDNIRAEKIIFCDGIHSADTPWFERLPFALNKGQALIIRAPGLPAENIFKKGLTLVPMGDDLFWAGASYEWEFTDRYPSSEFLVHTKNQLTHWLKVPFTVEAHHAALRPASLERRPFVGIHPHYPAIGILNGMGTKGCSLAPYFAHQFAEHLTKNTPILPEAAVSRFTRILQPSN